MAMKEGNTFDIAIIGAGPAGCSAALTLRNSTCSVALFEKSTFPREKICGDGICDRSINTLRSINPTYVDEFLSALSPVEVKDTNIFYKSRPYRIDFKSFGYTCKRYDFDNFLFSLVQRDGKSISVFQNIMIRSVEREGTLLKLQTDSGTMCRAKMVLVCNGASSKITRTLTGSSVDSSHMGVALRAYYEGVADMNPNTIELHYKKEVFPGYLWVFPMGDGTANVGFGCHLKDNAVQDRLRTAFEDWIKSDVVLSKRFANAQRITPLQGGLVPYNNKEFRCYGDNFCICGDAASLIDPISGGGIGSAMLSGHFAAQVAESCVQKHDCSQQATALYSQMLQKRIGKEVRVRYRLQRMFTKHPFLLEVLAFVGSQPIVLNAIKRWYFK